jgi:hypothetical protein
MRRSGFIRIRRVIFGVFWRLALFVLGHRLPLEYAPSSRRASRQNSRKTAASELMKPLLETRTCYLLKRVVKSSVMSWREDLSKGLASEEMLQQMAMTRPV